MGCRQTARNDGQAHRIAADFDILGAVIVEVFSELAQRQHRHAYGPQAEIADAGFVGRDQQRVAQCLFQMAVRDGNQPDQSGAESFISVFSVEFFQIKPQFREQFPRQPACALVEVFPDVFQDVGHLQALSERYGQRHEGGMMSGDFLRVITEQFGQHLANHTCHVITITIDFGAVFEAAGAVLFLKLHHAVRHRDYAIAEGLTLTRVEPVRNPQHPRHFPDQFANLRGSGVREQASQIIGKTVEVKLHTVERCSGHAGTYGVKTPTHPVAMKIGRPVFKAMAAQEPDVIASDCPMAGHHIAQGMAEAGTPAKAVQHPLSVVRRAYGL